jgi:hypothetical protein
MYMECIDWIAFAYACTSNISIEYLSHTHVHNIRCTCVCESYSIYTFDVHAYVKPIQFIHSVYMCMWKLFNLYSWCICECESYSSLWIHMYMECIDWIAFAYACTSNISIEYLSHTHVHRMYRLNSFRVSTNYSVYLFDVHVYAKAIQFIHSMYMCMRKLFNLYIRCTCVCESYSIYTFDVHAYAKAIQFIHSMYMCMLKLFNLYIRCTCVCETSNV